MTQLIILRTLAAAYALEHLTVTMVDTPWVGSASAYEAVDGLWLPRRGGGCVGALPQGLLTYWDGEVASVELI